MGTAMAVISFRKSCFWDCPSRKRFAHATGVVGFTFTLVMLERPAEDDEEDSWPVHSSKLSGLGHHNIERRSHICLHLMSNLYTCLYSNQKYISISTVEQTGPEVRSHMWQQSDPQ